MGYGQRVGVKATPQAKAQIERAEVLTGSRNEAAPEKRAVTREDAASTGNLKLLSAKVSATPTVDQYNALVTDIRGIAVILNSLGANITGL